MSTEAAIGVDQAPAESKPELARTDVLLRILYTFVFCVIIQAVSAVLGILVAFQIIYGLVTQSMPDERVTKFGRDLTSYIYHVFQYMTFNREVPPFPFSDLPEDGPEQVQA